ncbi:hypothetical protein KDI99_gp34 [Arthrobacter phage Greenhouse]|uniref:Uncharacterized protein n=1 Tax=Arthrobacter phage Greenhouse TaxID=1897428 RepID=A0A1I9SE84_9CAUD|nr:hypothetical protein KDI99_gp34 [Arthrobacter phage Greenhouse]AOZ65161.1 hypothetical protein SEA_GREENHOUSE_34 [Arthrobacter phage Greenhouse]
MVYWCFSHPELGAEMTKIADLTKGKTLLNLHGNEYTILSKKVPERRNRQPRR